VGRGVVELVERFLHDPVEVRFQVSVESRVSHAAGMKLYSDRAVTRPLVNVILDRGCETKIVENCGTQFPDEEVHFFVQPFPEILKMLDARVDPCAAMQIVFK